MKRGVSLIELLVAIGLISIIGLVSTTVFTISAENYRDNLQKSFFQKDLNFVIDDITNLGKESIEIPGEKEAYTLDTQTLILAVPAKDNENNFIYNGNVVEKDYYIFSHLGSELKKISYTHPQSRHASRNGKTSTVLQHVKSFQLEYSPGIGSPETIKAELTLSRDVGKRFIEISQSRVFKLRNKNL